MLWVLPYPKATKKPERAPIQTRVLIKWGYMSYMGFLLAWGRVSYESLEQDDESKDLPRVS